MKKITLIIFLLGLSTSVIFVGCEKEETAVAGDVIPVKTVELKKENLSLNISSSGQFTTDDETFLSFKTGGIVKAIYVKEGDAIKKGQLLAMLELTEIDAAVSQAKVGYEKAARDFRRVENLYKDSVATMAQYQDAKSASDIAVHQLEIAKYNLNHSEIRAITNGYILKKFVSEGELVNAGMPVLQTNGAGNGTWILKVGVSDNEWSAIHINDFALVESDATPNEKLEAKVFRKSEGVDPFSGTFTVDIKLISKPKIQLASGLFGRVVITPLQRVSSWVIPYESILDGEKDSAFVFVTNDFKTARKTKVKITELDEERLLVSAGLENSKALITSGSAYLNDGSSIRIVK
ncbi:MAG: efflux RND transporter periplasmic adaptor subunit [Ignavibacteria bacterium]|nr:efflux RND transporter periplasmic adaptor subunit [Ignavibacteria bacterium]